MTIYLEMLFKLLLAGVLGALIGFERENKNRPAGLRTNILVCIGAALIQIISIDIFFKYKGVTNIDPGRLGAQVISGIGFLGAGTILREGASIKGLTTAAGLWVVAGIGLAIGNGSYFPGIVTAVLAFITLTALSGVEKSMVRKSPFKNIQIEVDNRPGQIGKIGLIFGSMDIDIKNIEFLEEKDEKLKVYFTLKLPVNMDKNDVIKRLMIEDGVFSVEEL